MYQVFKTMEWSCHLQWVVLSPQDRSIPSKSGWCSWGPSAIMFQRVATFCSCCAADGLLTGLSFAVDSAHLASVDAIIHSIATKSRFSRLNLANARKLYRKCIHCWKTCKLQPRLVGVVVSIGLAPVTKFATVVLTWRCYTSVQVLQSLWLDKRLPRNTFTIVLQ